MNESSVYLVILPGTFPTFLLPSFWPSLRARRLRTMKIVSGVMTGAECRVCLDCDQVAPLLQLQVLPTLLSPRSGT